MQFLIVLIVLISLANSFFMHEKFKKFWLLVFLINLVNSAILIGIVIFSNLHTEVKIGCTFYIFCLFFVNFHLANDISKVKR